MQMVHVAYATEQRFFPSLLISMVSLSRHLPNASQCTIHLVLYEVDNASALRLLECFESALGTVPQMPGVVIHPYRFDPMVFAVRRYARQRQHHVTAKPITWARLRLHEYLPTVPRVLYLDTDTVVKSDVGRLYRMHMEYGLAAVLDSRLERSKAVPDIISDLEATSDCGRRGEINISYATYFCSGVMLLDLDRWKADRLGTVLEQWTRRVPTHRSLRAHWHDQDLLNVAFHGRVHILDWRWNAMGLGLEHYVSAKCLDEAWILHFTPQPLDWCSDGWWLRSWGGFRLKPYMDALQSCPKL